MISEPQEPLSDRVKLVDVHFFFFSFDESRIIIGSTSDVINQLRHFKTMPALSWENSGRCQVSEWQIPCSAVCVCATLPATAFTQTSGYILFFPWDRGSGRGLRYRWSTENTHTHTHMIHMVTPATIHMNTGPHGSLHSTGLTAALLLFSYLWLKRYRIWKRKQHWLPYANKKKKKKTQRRYQQACEVHTHKHSHTVE